MHIQNEMWGIRLRNAWVTMSMYAHVLIVSVPTYSIIAARRTEKTLTAVGTKIAGN